MNLTIFHYHLQPGGVTSVISRQVAAIAEHVDQIDSITLVCGRADHTETLYKKLAAQAGEYGTILRLDINPAIDYLSEEAEDDGRSQKLANELIDRYRDSIWWIHNYQLGKNPVFTQALLSIADQYRDQRIVFHIHDFPECSRYRNLDFLLSIVDQPVYPIASNVRYVVINGRDKDYLIKAGIPTTHVSLLDNPVESKPLDTSESKSKKTKDALRDTFKERFPDFDPSAPVLLYPVRTIRRKNVIELGLITRLVSQPVNLVVTLPGVSSREKPYSDAVEKAYRDRFIHGLWGVGHELDTAGVGFLDLVAAADLIVCSSIQEGFGLLYIDTLQWGHPLLARKIDVLEGISDALERPQVHLYESIQVPLDDSTKARLKSGYDEQIRLIEGHLEKNTIESLKADVETMLDSPTIDFSYLDIDGQLDLLRSVATDKNAASEIRELNKSTINAVTRLVQLDPEPVEPDSRFTRRGFADTTRRIIESFDAAREKPSEVTSLPEGAPPVGSSIQSKLLQLFASKEIIRLLYSAGSSA